MQEQMADKVKIGVIGCGNISEIYLKNLCTVFGNTQIVAVADVLEANALAQAKRFDIPHVCKSSEELLAMDEVEIVVILTNPQHHASLCMAALNAGKHVYVEKPLALCREDGRRLLALAEEKGLLLSCAPDTILGAGLQTCRKLIDDGWIGQPHGAMCHMLYHGPECWHPNPAFLYHEGAGVMFDVGPYFVAGLAYLLGPVKSVAASCKTTYPERMITSQPHYGEIIKVEVPTFIGGLMNFCGGAMATLMLTFDVRHTMQKNHLVEIYGTQGTLAVPSPCDFDGDIYYKNDAMADWKAIPSLFRYKTDSRGVGVADMADAIRNRRSPRVAAAMAYHALDVMEGFYDSQRDGRLISMDSTFERTMPLELNTAF